MRPGTPGFVGARLREGREARSLTAIALADLIGKSRAAVSQFEAGDASPSPDTMERIVDVLHLRPQFFLRPVAERAPRTVFYRSMNSTTKAVRMRSERRFDWFTEIVAFIRDFVTLPKVNFPEIDAPQDPTDITQEDIERAAMDARAFWRLGDGPAPNIAKLLEANGTAVTRSALGAQTMDAFSAWVPEEDVPYIVLGADKSAAARSRLDAGHELGHMLLHRHVGHRELAGDPVLFTLVERQAFSFASAFLLPATSFVDDLFEPSLDGFRALKRKWHASIGAMITRATDLNLITPERAQTLWRNRARRGWVKDEPLDDEMPVEEPTILRRALELVLQEQVVTRDELLSALPYSEEDIAALTGVPPEFLASEPPTNLRLLDAARARRKTLSREPAADNVVPLFGSRG